MCHLQQCLGSPVLGYLAAGILIGPYGLSIIRNVHGTKSIAEFGVVFLLFNIGLEVELHIRSCCTMTLIISLPKNN
jgi:predicted Kef-type K+ transport protein